MEYLIEPVDNPALQPRICGGHGPRHAMLHAYVREAEQWGYPSVVDEKLYENSGVTVITLSNGFRFDVTRYERPSFEPGRYLFLKENRWVIIEIFGVPDLKQCFWKYGGESTAYPLQTSDFGGGKDLHKVA